MESGKCSEDEHQTEVVSDDQPQEGDDDGWDSRQSKGGELDGWGKGGEGRGREEREGREGRGGEGGRGRGGGEGREERVGVL